MSQRSVHDFKLQFDDILDNPILYFNCRCKQCVGFVGVVYFLTVVKNLGACVSVPS